MSHTVYFGLGSNLGDREKYLRAAILCLNSLLGPISGLSLFRETKAVGYESQNTYLNAVVSIDTEIELRKCFDIIQGLERELGRVRDPQGPRYQDRTIDIDILFYDSEVYSDAELTVPHPRIAERKFVLEPLCDIDPDFIHPTLKLKLSDLLYRLEN